MVRQSVAVMGRDPMRQDNKQCIQSNNELLYSKKDCCDKALEAYTQALKLIPENEDDLSGTFDG